MDDSLMVDGLRPETVLRPETDAEAAEMLDGARAAGQVVVPVGGATAVDLVMKADHQKQSVSLLTGTPGADNIVANTCTK